jgi:hypothetical protein
VELVIFGEELPLLPLSFLASAQARENDLFDGAWTCHLSISPPTVRWHADFNHHHH